MWCCLTQQSSPVGGCWAGGEVGRWVLVHVPATSQRGAQQRRSRWQLICCAVPAPILADLPPVAEGQPPYATVLVDKFIAGKLRPHQVEGVRLLLASAPLSSSSSVRCSAAMQKQTRAAPELKVPLGACKVQCLLAFLQSPNRCRVIPCCLQVQFMFKCLAGLKDPNFRGCIQVGRTCKSAQRSAP